MSRKRKILLGSLISLVTLVASIAVFCFWCIGIIKKDLEYVKGIESTVPSELAYLTQDSVEHRGKILTIVTSHAKLGNTANVTGYELTELARAYFVFKANGFEVDVASPAGGNAPVVIDDGLGAYDYAFLNDSSTQAKVRNTIPLKEVNPEDYEAVYFVGGKGAMFDLPDNEYVQHIVADFWESNKVVGAVCHGPAALANVQLADNSFLLDGKKVSSFTNTEEFFLIPDAKEIFPFMLQEKLIERGAEFQEGAMYLENVATHGNLVTGQNPWSAWSVAESMILQMGYASKYRERTPEENAVQILKVYDSLGYQNSKSYLKTLLDKEMEIQREVIAVHGIVGIMQLDLVKTFNLVRLLSHL